MKSLLEKKNEHLKNVIGMLMDTVRDRDKEIEVLRSASSAPHQFSDEDGIITLTTEDGRQYSMFKNVFDMLIAKGDKFAEKISEFIKEKMEESDVAFSSRFMPNIKFKYDLVAQKLMSSIPTATTFRGGAYFGYSTDRNGKLYNGYEDFNIYKSCLLKEVSIYEAKPELVPKCMFYDKKEEVLRYRIDPEKEKAAKKVAEQLGFIPDPISSLAKNIARSHSFTAIGVQWVINTFGEDKVCNILDMLSACGLRTSDIDPLKR